MDGRGPGRGDGGRIPRPGNKRGRRRGRVPQSLGAVPGKRQDRFSQV